MDTDRDKKAVLPDPPPPRPDRREATIEAALSRFDAPGAEHPLEHRARRAWVLRYRPQLGVLVAATLVAVICLPVLWVVIGNPRPEGSTVALDTFERMPNLETSPPAATEPSEGRDTLADNAREAPAAIAAAPAEELGTRADAAPAPAPPPPPVPIEISPAPPPAIVALPAPAAPPPPMAERTQVQAAARAQAESLAISAFQTRKAAAGRGDWNACTLDDPAQSLSLCADRIDPAEKGTRGRASAFLADGLLRGWQGDLDAAIAAFSRAIAADPHLADAYLNRGLAYQAKGELDRARADLDRAVDYAPSAARTYHVRSLLLRERGKTRQADKDEDRALKLDPAYEAVITPRSER